ncbi:hypothetical protein [Streptomyces sp. GESEQ-35]|uniref:hypothetical protein n=1 Tax=Streptomyces sp. GESEQ-35 TaxID=2812657 RepID=UPI001FF5F86E|nr:hypothetical protein [Streptomyces sp. GESEQ-35]
MTINAEDPVPAVRVGAQGVQGVQGESRTSQTSQTSQVSQVSQEEDETSTADLVLPLVAASAAVALAGYAYVRRTRRMRTRTTPGGATVVASAPLATELDEQARALLIEADDCVRTSREELGFAEALLGTAAVAPFARALRDAESELSSAFRMRQQYDDGVPADGASRRHALAGIVGRCQEAGRRLDAEAAGFDQLRGLERGVGEALEAAETRFRELAGRAGAVEATLADLVNRYAHAATAPVTGDVEQAKDRLVFATSRLNEARQATDSHEAERAARHLRAAESAVAQATVFLDTIDHLARELTEAETLVPATLTGAEAEIAGARGRLPDAGGGVGATEGGARSGTGADASADGGGDRATGGGAEGIGTGTGGDAGTSADSGGGRTTSGDVGDTGTGTDPAGRGAGTPSAIGGLAVDQAGGGGPDVPVGELRARIRHADGVLAAVREELTGGPYDPLDALRRIVRAVVPVASGRAGVLPTAALLAARASVALADGFVVTHRGAMGSEARTLLAEAERLLAAGPEERAAAGLRAGSRDRTAAADQNRAPEVGRLRPPERTVTGDRATADTLARHALALAEQDVRVHGNPVAGTAREMGVSGAVLGGILLGGAPDGGPPASFGGPHSRARRGGTAT